MKYILALLISLSLMAPAVTVAAAADKAPVTKVEKKVKKKHKKYAGTKIPEKASK